MLIQNEFGQTVGYQVVDWSTKEEPFKSSLKGNYCILEPMEINKHGSKLYDSLLIDNHGESWTYLPYGPFKSFAEFHDWLKITNSEKEVLLYSILDVINNIPIGIAGYLRINPEHGVIEIGHLHFSKLLQKTPAATEAMYLMLKNVFDTLQYRRCEWKCNALNKASWNAALRLGFQFEGVFRQSNVYKNFNRDTAWFSIINQEWPTLKERFHRWLHPDNFDMYGNQKLSLREI